ncbi:MAG TPA: acyl-CoA dehydrogenase family protein [Ramlibacter sp.]|nr:acyl-CoA dehydrogenase family protein [Ramlibacter sp.]
MNFAPTNDQQEIEHAIGRICERFDAAYWRRKDSEGGFPHDFHAALAEAGWLGIAMPEEVGGAGLGITEAAIMMRTIAASGAGLTGASAVHMNIFGLHPVVRHGTPEQRQRWLPPLIAGVQKACFGVTEPDAGLNTLSLKTRAERRGDRYVVNGQKMWISTAQVAHKILLLARTSERDPAAPTRGLTLFYTDLNRSRIEVREIDKHGRKAVDSNQLFIDDLEVPIEDRIGEEGRGFEYILDGMNPERILIASEAVGIGRAALARASKYAGERVVFGRPIGQNQGIQHPLAQRWIDLEAADLLTMRAAWRYDSRMPCGPDAGAAKYAAGEAGYRACETAVLTLGGMGYSKEYDVERYLREVMITRIAPITPQLILSFIAEKVLHLPKSY